MDLLRNGHAERLMPTARCHSELRLAAAKMRERAEAATPGPWEGYYDDRGRPYAAVNESLYGDAVARLEDDFDRSAEGPHGSIGADAYHIASWHPAVALAVADWLDAAVKHFHGEEAAHADELARGKYPYWSPRIDPLALAVARAYLGSTDA